MSSDLKHPLGDSRECGDTHVAAGRGGGQLGWYEFASKSLAGKNVLDAGCGLGKGIPILKQNAAMVKGQDLDDRLASDDIDVGDISRIDTNSYDVVVCVDVIEHIPVDHVGSFVGHLARVARERIFVSTPNWTASKCQWPFHVKEYTPREFHDLLSPAGTVTLYKGTPSGNEQYAVTKHELYYCFNDLRVSFPTAFVAKCWNHILPRSRRIHSHNAAWVDVSKCRHPLS